MDSQLADLLHDLHEHGVTHDADKPDRLDRLRNLEPDSAKLLSLLVRATGAQTVLELGTSNGYATIWLAEAVRATGGRLTSVEIDAARSAAAAENLERAGLSSVVELRVQDAAVTLRSSADAQWDLIFLDAERPAYPSYLPELQRAAAVPSPRGVDHGADKSSPHALAASGGFGEQVLQVADVRFAGAGMLQELHDADEPAVEPGAERVHASVGRKLLPGSIKG